ncbi:hypothetical protein, partial [Propylenella binzhouense]|uniref:hypothetical protein n=1 Tax=Propylenella binzhouense TaxID=2555902 RepID=UPI003CCE3BE7
MSTKLLAGTAIACLLATGALAAEPAQLQSFQVAQATTPPAGGAESGGMNATSPSTGGMSGGAAGGAADSATTP